MDGDEGFEFSGALEVALGDVGDDGAFALREVEAFLEAFVLEGFFDESRDGADLGGADDEVDVGVAAFDFVGPDLGHASGDADDHFGAGFFEGGELSEKGEGFVFGFFPDGAGVEEDDVGFAPVLGGFEAELFEVEGHLFAVFLVHLASPGLDEIGSAPGFFAAGVGVGAWLDEGDVAHVAGWFGGEGYLWSDTSPGGGRG